MISIFTGVLIFILSTVAAPIAFYKYCVYQKNAQVKNGILIHKRLINELDNSRPAYIEKRQWTLMITQLEKAQSLEQTLRLRIMLMAEY